MMRRPDWRDRLVSYLHSARQRPFEFGQHDCSLFAADCVAAMTGNDMAADWRGRYATMRGGLRVLRKAGFDVRGMSAFFGRLQKAMSMYESNATAYLRTHPLSGERRA